MKKNIARTEINKASPMKPQMIGERKSGQVLWYIFPSKTYEKCEHDKSSCVTLDNIISLFLWVIGFMAMRKEDDYVIVTQSYKLEV
jgi:hypothetical protein